MNLFPRIRNALHSTKISAFGLQITIIAILFQICEQIAYADSIEVESDTQIIVSITPLTQTGGSLTLTLLDDLNHPVIDVPVQIDIFTKDGQPIKQDKSITDPEGQAVFNLGLSPNSYTVKAEFPGYASWRASSQTHKFEIIRCHANTYLKESEPIFQPSSKPLAFNIYRSECLQFDADYMVSIGSASDRVHLNEGQDHIQIQLTPTFSKPDILPLEIAIIEGNIYEPEVLNHDVIFYDSISNSPPQIKQHWQNISAELQLHPYLKRFPVTLKFHDIEIETTSDERGIARFNLPQTASGCIVTDIFRTDQYREFGLISSEICIPKNTSNWQLVLSGMLFLFTAFLAIGLFKKLHSKHKLPSPDKIQKTIPIHSTALPPENSDMCRIICQAADINLIPADVEFEINGKIERPEAWPFTTNKSGFIRIKHPECLSWQGNLKPGHQHVITLTTRREYAISCFNQATNENLIWGKETPNQLLEILKNQYSDKDKQDKAKKFCTLISETAFNNKNLSDDDLKELYKYAMEFKRAPLRFTKHTS